MTLILEKSALPHAKYIALSYMWGYKASSFLPRDLRHQSKTQIKCQGASLEVSHEVTPNLYAALHQLRQPDHNKVLWIDAICINQDEKDNEAKEKTGQLKLMGKIYTRAQQTIVWLGQETYASSLSFKAIRSLCPIMLRRLNTPHKLQEQAQQKPSGAFQSQTYYWEFVIYTWALIQLLQNPYFTRVWIVQEIALSQDIEFRLGPECVSMKQMEAAAATLSTIDLGTRNSRNLSYILAIRSLVRGQSITSPEGVSSRLRRILAERLDLEHGIFSLMSLFRGSLATYKIDKIYGLMGLCRNLENVQTFGIEENYKLDQQDAYRTAAVSMLRRKRDLDLFAALSFRSSGGNTATLPSWVPDWSDTQHLSLPISTRFRNVVMTVDSQFEDDAYDGHYKLFPKVLILSGYMIDWIHQTGRPCNTEKAQPSAWLCFRSIYTFAGSHRLQILADWWTEFGKKAVTAEEFEITVTCGLASDYPEGSIIDIAMRFQKTGLNDLPIHYKLLCIFVLSISYLKPTRIVLYFVTLQYLAVITTYFIVTYVAFSILPYLVLFNLKEQESDFYNDGLVYMEGRTMARTKVGRLALVPEHSRKEDIIVICKGGRVPLVLRRVAMRDEFQIIGECYVYGVMNGEETYDGNRHKRISIV